MPDEQGGAQGAAGVAGGGLDPDVVEGPFAQQPAVGHAVQRHAAGQHQVLLPRLRVDVRPPCAAPTSSVTAWMLAARSMWICSRSDSGCRGGPPKSP